MVANVIGNLAEGDNFFDRKEELAALQEEGLLQNLLLLAPRRVGKTSLMHRLATVSKGQSGWHAIYLTIEDVHDEASFVRELVEQLKANPAAKPCHKALKSGPIKRFLAFLESIESVKAGPVEVSRKTTTAVSDDLKRALREALKLLPGHWFFLIDEVPLFVVDLLQQDSTGTRARHFLQWFRSLRQRDVDAVMSIHWVLAGSIGLDTVAEEHGLTDTINDLKVVRLGAFREGDAKDFLRALGQRYGIALGDDVVAATCERAGWLIPYHLQVMFGELRELHGEVRRALTVDDVTTCFSRAVGNSAYFSTWYERLPKELGEQRAAQARLVLTATARDAGGATTETLSQGLAKSIVDGEARDRELRLLLRILVSDGYLREDSGRWPFRSNLLRAWWLRRWA